MRFTLPPIDPEPLSDYERQAFLAAARRYMGTPWQHMGRNAWGLDCAGLIAVVIRDVLGTGPDASDYSNWPDMKTMREMCRKLLRPIIREDILPGDVALMYAPGVGVVHLGWYAGITLIHSNNEPHARKVVESSHQPWNLRGAYRVPRFTVN